MSPTDSELLGEFVRNRSQPAFAELVRRHVDWIYSAALRRIRDPHLAEDVTQAAFLVLAQKAKSLGNQTVLSAWLFHVVNNIARRARSREAARKLHEAIAAKQKLQMQHLKEEDGRTSEKIADLLEESVEKLRRSDREAVILRFYDRKSFAEIGQTLGITEEAARKRVSRAVEQLRRRIAEKNVTIAASTLESCLSAGVVIHSPVTLVRSIVSASSGIAAGTDAVALAKGAIAMIAWSKVKLAVAVAVGAVLLGGASLVLLNAPAPAPISPDAAGRPTTAPNTFAVIYRLDPGQGVKRIDPSEFPPDRASGARMPEAQLPPDRVMSFRWDESTQVAQRWTVQAGPISLASVLQELGIEPHALEQPPEAPWWSLPGDWVVRRTVDENELAAYAEMAMEIFRQDLGASPELRRRSEEREVIVARGRYNTPQSPGGRLAIGQQQSRKPPQPRGSGTATLHDLLTTLANYVNQHIVDETASATDQVRYDIPDSFDLDALRKDHALADEILANISNQCGITFVREQRVVTMWSLHNTAPTTKRSRGN